MAGTSARDWPVSVLVAARLISFAVICAALYLGQAVLVPLVLAALLTFLLSPLVTRLDRLRVPRVVGVLLVMALVGGVIGGIGYVVAGRSAASPPSCRRIGRTSARRSARSSRSRAAARSRTSRTRSRTSARSSRRAASLRRRARESGATTSPCAIAVEQSPPLLGNARVARAVVRRRRHVRAHAAARDLHAHQSRGPARSARQPLGQAVARGRDESVRGCRRNGSAVTC